jgi:hypothetical protein
MPREHDETKIATAKKVMQTNTIAFIQQGIFRFKKEIG